MEKMVKNGAGKSLYFMQKQNDQKAYKVNMKVMMENQNSNQNKKVGEMVVLVYFFDHYHPKFQLFQLSCKNVKDFEAEN